MPVLKQFLLQRIHDLQAGCVTVPTAAAWRRCLLYYLAFVVCAVPLGFVSGLLKFERLRVGSVALLLLVAHIFVSPALIEDLVFRGLLLPQDHRGIPRRRLLALCGASLCLFVASHVANGLLFHRVGVFTNGWFLLEAAMLGAMCIAAYLESGSVWPGVLAHWLTVTIWIILFGGARLVGLHAGP